jgi:hypothetical protein
VSTYRWKSAVNGSWNNPALWDTGQVPVVNAGSNTLTNGNPYYDSSADTAVFDTGSIAAYAVTGTGHAVALQVAHDTVIFDNFSFSNNGYGTTQPYPTLTVTDGAAVVLGPNTTFTLLQTVSDPYGTFGAITVNNATLLVQGSLAGTLDIQDKGIITVAAGGTLRSPPTNHSPLPLAVIEAGGTLNVQAGSTVEAPLYHLDGTLNIDQAKAQSGTVSASGAINGSNGATLTGLYYQYLANTQNAGTITATAGRFTITGSVAGTGQLRINPGATLVLNDTDTNAISFVSDGATLELATTAKISGVLDGFARGDAVDLQGVQVTNLTVGGASGLTTVTAYNAGTQLNSFTLAGDYSLADLAFTGDGRGGSLISYVDHAPAPPPPAVSFGITNTTTGVSSSVSGERYVGPVAGVDTDYITVTPDNLAIAAVTPNVFIHTGGGQDAIRALGGRNVLDGGTGSNFLTAGTGTDTFFVDARNAPSDTWSTVVGAKAGDDVTVFGITPDTFAVSWVDGQGATGSLGLTMHATSASHPQASFTLAGFSTADLASGKVSTAFGANGNEPYLNLHVN